MSRSVRPLHRAVAVIVVAAAILVLVVVGTGSATAAKSKPPVKVGIFEIAPASVITEIAKGFQKEMKAKLKGRKVTFEIKNAQGQQTLIQSIARNFARGSDDMIAVIGTPAVIAMAKLEKKKPILALAMGDPVGSKVSKSLDKPGTNVTGSTDFVDPAKLLAVITKTIPAPKTIGTIFDPSNQNSQTWVKALVAAGKKYKVGINQATIASSSDINTATRSLAGKADAILIGPDAAVVSALPAVAAPVRANNTPLYVVGGDVSIAGVLASLGPSYGKLGTQSGALAARIVLGAKPQTTPYVRPGALTAAVNKTTLKGLNLTLPSLLAKAAK